MCLQPLHTFATKGPEEGDEGPVRTRIEIIFANNAAMALVKSCSLEWDITPQGHVPLKVVLGTEGYKGRRVGRKGTKVER